MINVTRATRAAVDRLERDWLSGTQARDLSFCIEAVGSGGLRLLVEAAMCCVWMAEKEAAGEAEEQLFAELRSLRLKDGRDPFDLYRHSKASKGWLIGHIVECVLELRSQAGQQSRAEATAEARRDEAREEGGR